ncbi:hypothetical protein J5751_01050 [bacterium]|nr:hypothetical protein [bacterium]
MYIALDFTFDASFQMYSNINFGFSAIYSFVISDSIFSSLSSCISSSSSSSLSVVSEDVLSSSKVSSLSLVSVDTSLNFSGFKLSHVWLSLLNNHCHPFLLNRIFIS